MDCIFCQIVAKKLPSINIYEDEHAIAFMDIQPVNAGHMLVIPKSHASYLADLDDDTGAHIFRVSHRLVAAVRKSGLKCEGVNLFLADGEAAMQEVFHVHLHVFPRFKGDGFGLTFSQEYFTKPPQSKLEDAAIKIRAAL
jgi:histidine triad (HIT) family protein